MNAPDSAGLPDHRRICYFEGSPAAGLVARMPAGIERQSLGVQAPGDPLRGVLLTDTSGSWLDRALVLAEKNPDLQIVALVPPGETVPAGRPGIGLCLPLATPGPLLAHALDTVFAHQALRAALAHARQELGQMRSQFQHLNAIGIRLSAERDTEALLELILTKAREITRSDAGSLYLVEHADGVPHLSFKLVQNDSFATPFKGTTLPITMGSIAGYVALTGQPVNLADAYTLPPESPFTIDRSYDERAGYRSKSMLVVPMKNPKDQTIGVLQLINCKTDTAHRLASAAAIEREVVPFSPRFQELALSLASQAAVALEKSRLYEELRTAVAELEASHERIVRTERLRAIGELATGVAHDFNNTLAVILGRAQLLQEETEDPRLRAQLQIIEEAALGGAQTVRRIQEFARVRRVRPFQAVDLNDVVRRAVETTRSRWRDTALAQGTVYDVRVETEPLGPVIGDPLELREALTNLIFNALDAMPDGGRLLLRTHVERQHVVCVITDSGTGMTDEVRRRAFEPFFSTKDVRGRGLGLSVAYGIVTRHGGDIEARSQPGEGSSFTIRLPLGEGALAEPPGLPSTTEMPHLRVLVIDDEPQVRRIMVHVLAREGHEVVECQDGRTGLARVERERFDLVLTDLSMPGLSGLDVAREVKRYQPGVPIILVTGWGAQLEPAEGRPESVDLVVTKPFQRQELLAAVAAVARRTT